MTKSINSNLHSIFFSIFFSFNLFKKKSYILLPLLNLSLSELYENKLWFMIGFQGPETCLPCLHHPVLRPLRGRRQGFPVHVHDLRALRSPRLRVSQVEYLLNLLKIILPSIFKFQFRIFCIFTFLFLFLVFNRKQS